MQVGIRRTLAVIVMSSVMVFLTVYEAFTEDTVYSCNDMDKNPPDVVKQCKHLTKYQWWGAYYQGIRK